VADPALDRVRGAADWRPVVRALPGGKFSKAPRQGLE
jgi:hypothetical protein